MQSCNSILSESQSKFRCQGPKIGTISDVGVRKLEGIQIFGLQLLDRMRTETFLSI